MAWRKCLSFFIGILILKVFDTPSYLAVVVIKLLNNTMSNRKVKYKLEVVLLLVAVVHILICPFTKVEESFNLQAIHDILYHRTNISQYDHLEFPGVVPRTFIGPIVVSCVAAPFVAALDALQFSKEYSQYVVRMALGVLVLCGFHQFRVSVEKSFGKTVALWLVVITASQFHFVYYLSRTLPNTFALIPTLFAFYFWMEHKHLKFLIASGIAVIIFRGELALLLGLMLLNDMIANKRIFLKVLKYGVLLSAFLLALTVCVDSYFWQRPLWPEGEVLFFNLYENKSVNWGTSPFLWYFYSAIPRAMSSSLLLVPIGLWIDRRTRRVIFPAIGFIILYSFLPHKELRFIIYVFPLLNVAAARACCYFWENRSKSIVRRSFAFLAVAHLLVNVSTTSVLLYVSKLNYPGGLALQKLHQIESYKSNANLYIDVFSAQTGISRFGQIMPTWRYNKTEAITLKDPAMLNFTHIIVNARSEFSSNIKHFRSSHAVLSSIQSFSHLNFNYNSWLPLTVRKKTTILILKKRKK